MKIAITGATGYIGRRVVRQALMDGHEVISLSRRVPTDKVEWLYFDLSSEIDSFLPKGTEVLIHLAAITDGESVDTNTELKAAHRLIEAARRVNARFMFLSSQAAREDAPTDYGRLKWSIEQIVLAKGGCVARPGLVYGGPEVALFGKITKLVRGLPFIPAFIPSPTVQPVHVDDLARCILNLAIWERGSHRIVCVGAPDPVPFTTFLSVVAKVRVGQYRLPLPVPVVMVRALTVVLGKKLSAKLGLERLSSLFDLSVMDSRQDLNFLGVELRPLAAGMTPSGGTIRRLLISEGRSLLAYVFKAAPPSTLVRRYVLCIEELREGRPLPLPSILLQCPMLLSFMDDRSTLAKIYGEEIEWRLNCAVALAEASVEGAHRFLINKGGYGLVGGLISMARAVTMEIGVRMLRPAVRFALKRCFRDVKS